MTPLGSVAKMLMESIKGLKNKTEVPAWQDTVSKLKYNGEKRWKYKKMVEEDSEESMNQMALKGFRDKMMGKKELSVDIDVDELMKKPEKLTEFVNKHKKSKTREGKVVDLIRDGMKLVYSITGQNTTNFDQKTLKLVSPRFLGLTKETKEKDEVGTCR